MSFNHWLYGKYGYHTISVFSLALAVALLVPHLAVFIIWKLAGTKLPLAPHVAYVWGLPVMAIVGLLIFILLFACRYTPLSNMLNMMPTPYYNADNRTLYAPWQLSALNLGILCFMPFALVPALYTPIYGFTQGEELWIILTGPALFAISVVVMHVCTHGLSKNLSTLQGEALAQYRAKEATQIEAYAKRLALNRYKVVDWLLELLIMAGLSVVLFFSVGNFIRPYNLLFALLLTLAVAIGRTLEVRLPFLRSMAEASEASVAKRARLIRCLRVLLAVGGVLMVLPQA